MKNHDFHRGKMVAVGCFLNTFVIFDGGDLMKNHDFHEGKMVAVRRFLNIFFDF